MGAATVGSRAHRVRSSGEQRAGRTSLRSQLSNSAAHNGGDGAARSQRVADGGIPDRRKSSTSTITVNLESTHVLQSSRTVFRRLLICSKKKPVHRVAVIETHAPARARSALPSCAERAVTDHGVAASEPRSAPMECRPAPQLCLGICRATAARQSLLLVSYVRWSDQSLRVLVDSNRRPLLSGERPPARANPSSYRTRCRSTIDLRPLVDELGVSSIGALAQRAPCHRESSCGVAVP